MTQINPAELAFASWQAAEELARQREVVDARMYLEGAQVTHTTARIRALLGLAAGDDVRLKLNIIHTIVSAVTERLAVTNVQAVAETPEAGDDEAGSEATAALGAWADRVWQGNKLSVKQDDIYTDAVNDGESFVIVDYREDFGPRIIPHPRYTDTMAEASSSVDASNIRAGEVGDGFGCKVFYENDDPNQDIVRASKRWREELGAGKARMRLTEYYPDRIEKYDVGKGRPEPIRDEGDTAWPIPWVDAAGNPLGVPVFSFDNPARRPEAFDAWGVQDAVNQAFIDLLAGNRSAAFRIFKAFGFYPTTDGKQPASDRSNWLSIEPGGIYGDAGKSPSEATFEPIDGMSPEAFLQTLNELIQKAASTTDTPLSRFQISGQVAGADTQQEYKEPLYIKAEKRQLRFGAAWADVFGMALKLERVFGGVALPETARFTPVWKPVKPRNIDELQKEASAKKASGIPEEVIWREVWGYSEQQVMAMKQEESYMQRQAIVNNSLAAQGARDS